MKQVPKTGQMSFIAVSSKGGGALIGASPMYERASVRVSCHPQFAFA